MSLNSKWISQVLGTHAFAASSVRKGPPIHGSRGCRKATVPGRRSRDRSATLEQPLPTSDGKIHGSSTLKGGEWNLENAESPSCPWEWGKSALTASVTLGRLWAGCEWTENQETCLKTEFSFILEESEKTTAMGSSYSVSVKLKSIWDWKVCPGVGA